MKSAKEERWSVTREMLYWHVLSRIPTSLGFRLRNVYLSSALEHIGSGVTIATKVKIISPHLIWLDDRVGIANDVIIDGRGSVRIGKNSIVGFRSVILTSTHLFNRIDSPIRDQGMSTAPVKIGENVWIGANVYILPGVTVGDGAVVGACAVVTRDLPSNSVCAGVPATVLRYRVPH